MTDQLTDYYAEREPLDIEEESTLYTHTEGVIIRPDNTVTLIRLTPNMETVSAVMGDWCTGFSRHGSPYAAWAPIGDGVLFIASSDRLGHGEPNLLAQKVFHRLTGHEMDTRGVLLIANERAERADSDRMDAAVIEGAVAVLNLREPTRRDDERGWE